MSGFFAYLIDLVKHHPWFFGISIVFLADGCRLIIRDKKPDLIPGILIWLLTVVLTVIQLLICIWLIEIIPVKFLNWVVALVAGVYLCELVSNIEYKLIEISKRD